METKENKIIIQDTPRKKITHIRIPIYLKRRLDKIRKDTGRQLDLINAEIIQLGLEKYYEDQE